MRKLFTHLLAAAFVLPLFAAAQDELSTGPAAGSALTPAMAYGSGGKHSGPYDGRELDVAAEIGNGPGAILFMHELTRNILPVVRELDNLGAEFSLLGFKSFTVFLSGDRTAAENRMKAVNGSLRLKNPVLVGLDGAEGPGNYALNRKATLSLILVKNGKVIRTHAYTDVNEKDRERLRTWVEEIAGKLPTDAREYRKLVAENLPTDAAALRAQALDQAVEIFRLNQRLAKLEEQGGGAYSARNRMAPQRREAGASRMAPPSRTADAPAAPRDGKMNRPQPDAVKTERRGAPPTDVELNGLLRSFIRKTNEEEQIQKVFEDIKARAAESDDLNQQAVEMFKLMLSYRDRYGNEQSQKLAEQFLKANGAEANK